MKWIIYLEKIIKGGGRLDNYVPMSLAAASAAKTGDKLFTKKKLDTPSLMRWVIEISIL